MLTVKIDICGDEIVKVSAVRISGDGKGCICKYKLFDENKIPFAVIEHNYDRGAEALAVLMLNNYVNYKKTKEKSKVFDDKQIRFCDENK